MKVPNNAFCFRVWTNGYLLKVPFLSKNVGSMHTESAHPDYSKDTDLLLTDTIMQFGSNNSNISPWHPYSKIIVWLAAITIISSIYSIHKFNTNGYNIILSPAMAPLSNTPLESTETIKHKTNVNGKFDSNLNY